MAETYVLNVARMHKTATPPYRSGTGAQKVWFKGLFLFIQGAGGAALGL